jgi:hypothetical protein
MSTRFNVVLNNMAKMWNIPILPLVLAGGVGGLGWMSKGMMFGVAGAGIGFSVGGWVALRMHKGELQKQIYWNIPINKMILLVNQKIRVPVSYFRNFF